MHIVNQFVQTPTSAHYDAILRIVHDLHDTINKILFYSSSSYLKFRAYSSSSYLEFRAYSNANYTRDPITHRFTTGFYFS